MANTFSPVLHKHSWDRQPGLADFESTIYSHSTLRGSNVQGQLVYSNRVPPIHTSTDWRWDSFGSGSLYVAWKIDIDDEMRYTAVPGGYGPLYFHVYKPNSEDRYYYLQYWYFFPMNDVSGQSTFQTWHEGDWEHVALKLQRTTGSTFTPLAINFYLHEGGKTRTPAQAWWSSSNSLTYSGIQQGYDASHTHLHIWLAANSHASYNRFESVYKLEVEFRDLAGIDTYIDNVDYDPGGSDLYFPYDMLVNLGEVTSCTNCLAHGYTWFNHMSANNATPGWLPYIGLIGDYWTNGVAQTPSTTSPSRHFSWRIFEEDYSQHGFGNSNEHPWYQIWKNVSWVQDSPSGD